MTLTEAAGSQSSADMAMDQYASGDEAAFETLYDALKVPLFVHALRRTGRRDAAEDLLHQTYFKIIRARDSWVRGAAVLPWAFAILRRLIIDRSRRHSREELGDDGAARVEECTGEPGADEAMALHEEGLAARRALASLPRMYREAFELVKLDGLSTAEAAEILGITANNVKQRVHRAKGTLARAAAKRASTEVP